MTAAIKFFKDRFLAVRKTLCCMVLTLCVCFYPSIKVQCQDHHWLQWGKQMQLPVSKGLSNMIAGSSNQTLIVAGGSNFTRPKWDGGEKLYHDSIFVLSDLNRGKWVCAGRLPRRLAESAAVPYKDGLLCFGGTDGKQVFSDVFFLRWNSSRKTVEINASYPALPKPLSALAAEIVGDKVYITGGRDHQNNINNDFWYIDLEAGEEKQVAWRQLPSQPGAARFGANLKAQNNGEYTSLYLFGGKSSDSYLKDAFVYDLTKNNWRRIADLPRPALFAATATLGQTHILLFSGSDGHDATKALELKDKYSMVRDVLAYHTITNTWIPVAEMPVGVAGASVVHWNGQYLIIGGELRPSVRTPVIQAATLDIQSAKANFEWIDYATLVLYLLILSGISYYFSRRKQSANDYLLGGQRIPFWAAGISVMATQVSAIGFMSIPAKAYAVNWAYFAGVFTWFIAVPIVTSSYIPFVRKMKVVSAYQYLEARFNSGTRLFAAVVFVLFQLARMGLVLYLPALALSAVTPLDTITCILIMGVLSTFYTVLGGIEAVIWIEVVQALLLFGGAVICICLAISGIDGGLSTMLDVGMKEGKFSLGELNWGITSSTLFVILLGNVFNRVGNLTADQAVVQRYLTTPTTKEAKKSVWADVAASIPWAIVIYALGTALYVFYKQHPHQVNPSLGIDGTLPLFISQQAPAGLSGLIIAGIFAASMSTLEGSIHSVATIFTKDFYGKYKGHLSERETYRTAQVATVVLGVLATGIALGLVFLDITSILDVFQELTGLFIGASAGLFMLGIFTTRSNGTGALIGALSSGVILYFVKSYTPVSFWLYSGIGFVSCFLIGYICSIFLRGKKQIQGLTYYTIDESIQNQKQN
jgi:SSS family transporter